jgi:hypothetical protein
MSNIRALQRLGGTPAPINPLSEEEKAATQQRQELKPRPQLPEKPSRALKPRAPRTQNPLEGASSVIKKAVNEYKWATKATGNVIGNVIRGAAGKEPVTVEQAEQAVQFRQKTGTQKLPDRINTITKPVSDAKRIIGGGVVRTVEGAVGSAIFVDDLIQMRRDRTLRRETDPSLNPFHIKYIEPELNTGIAVPDSTLGRLGQGIVSLVGTATSVTTRLPKAGTKLGAFARGEAGGVAADLLLTKKGDGNLTALVRDVVPEEWRDSVLFFLASDDKDTAVSARLKNALEGVGLGAALGGLAALRAARNTPLKPEALKALPGGDKIAGLLPPGKPTLQEELIIRSEIYNRYLDADAASNLTNATREANRFDEINLRLLDELEAKQLELDLGSVPGSGRMEIDPGGPRQQQLTLEGANAPRDPSVDLDARAPEGADAAKNLDIAGPQRIETTPFKEGQQAAPARAPQPAEAPKAPEAGAKPPTEAPRVDPAAVREGIQSKVDLGYSPQDFSLMPQERGATFTPTSPDVALRADYPTQTLTDAQVKSFRWEDKMEEGFRNFEQSPQVKAILTEPTLPDKKVIADSFEGMNRIREAAGEKEFFQVPNPSKGFEEQGLIQLVKKPDGSIQRIFTEPGVVAARVFFRDIGNHAWDTAKKMADLAEEGKPFGNLPDKMLDDLIAMLNIGKKTQQMGGRLTRAWGLPIDQSTGTMSLGKDIDGISGFDEAISKVKEIQDALTAGRDDLVRDDLNILGAMLRASEGKPEKIMSFWKLARTVGFKDAGTNMIQSLFSGARTQLVSLAGNTYTAVERPASAMINAAMKGDVHSARMAIAGMRATVQAIPEALQLGFAAIKNGPAGYVYTQGGKYIQQEANTVNAIQELLARARTPGEKAAANFLNLQHKFITANPLFDYGPRLLSSGDEAFQHLALRQWAAMESMYKASSSSMNTKEAFEKYSKEFYDSKIGPDGRIIDPELKNWIAQTTFQGEVAEKIKALSDFLNKVPALKWFVPVVNTPAEILRYVGKHTVANRLFIEDYAEVVARVDAGDAAAIAKKAIYDGRVGLGFTIAASGGMIAMAGDLTGFGPPYGSKEWQQWQNLNKRPTSIRIGDQWYDFSSIEPMATILGAVGDAAMMINMGAADAGHNLAAQAMFTFGAAVLDKTVLTGIQEMAKVLDTRTSVDARQTAMISLLNNTLPASSLRRSLYNMFSPHRKEFQTTSERLWAQATIGLSDKGSVYIDPLTGESELSYAGGFYNANSPIRVVPENMDPLKWQLEKDGFGYKTNKRGINQVELSPEDRQKVHKLMFELGLREVLEEAVTDPNYRALADSWDRRPYDPDQPGSAPPHIAHLNRQWNKVRQAAIRTLMDQDPGFAQTMLEGAEKRRAFQNAEFENQGAPAPTVLNKLMQAPR